MKLKKRDLTLGVMIILGLVITLRGLGYSEYLMDDFREEEADDPAMMHLWACDGKLRAGIYLQCIFMAFFTLVMVDRIKDLEGEIKSLKDLSGHSNESESIGDDDIDQKTLEQSEDHPGGSGRWN